MLFTRRRRRLAIVVLLPLLVAVAAFVLLREPTPELDALARARRLLELDDADRACRELQTATRMNPLSSESWDLLASAHARLGETADAVRCRRRAVELVPAQVEARARLVEDLVADGDLAQAEWQLDLLVASAPMRTDSRRRRAEIRARRGLLDAALRDLEVLLRTASRAPDLLLDAATLACALAWGADSETHAVAARRHAEDALEWLPSDDPRREVTLWVAELGRAREVLADAVPAAVRRWTRVGADELPLGATRADRRVHVRRALALLPDEPTAAEVDALRASLATLLGRYPEDRVGLEVRAELIRRGHAPSDQGAGPDEVVRQRRIRRLVGVSVRQLAAGRPREAATTLDSVRWLAPLDQRWVAAHGACLGRSPRTPHELASAAVESERPGRGLGAFHRAAIHAAAGEPDEARRRLREAWAADPHNQVYVQALRRAARRAGDIEELRELGDGPDALASSELDRAMLEGDWTRAGAELTRLLEGPAAGRVDLRTVAGVALAVGTPRRAVEWLRREGLSAGSTMLRGYALLQAGEPERVLAGRAEAAARAPVSSRVLASLAWRRVGAAQRAIDELRTAADLAYDRSDACVALAELLLRERGVAAALAELDGRADDPRRGWAALHARGRVHLTSGRLEDGLDDLREVVRRRPFCVAARNDLAWALAVRAGSPSEALQHIVAARRHRALDPELLDTEGTVRLLLGETEAAVELLRRASRVVPERADIRARLAVALERHGEAAAARTERERALRQDPVAAGHSLRQLADAAREASAAIAPTDSEEDR